MVVISCGRLWKVVEWRVGEMESLEKMEKTKRTDGWKDKK